AYNVTITPGNLPEDAERERAVLQRLAQMIDVPYSAVEREEPYQPELWTVGRTQFPPFGAEPEPGLIEQIDAVRYNDPYAPLIVAENIDRELALLIAQEGSVTMPGVGVQIIPRRSYPSGALTSQTIGFLGKIPPEQVEDFEAQGYDPNVDRIGYAGVEASMEEYLRGVPGRKYVEKDFLGQELRTVGEVIDPVSGDNIHLTLDLELQQVAEEALRAQLEATSSQRGVVIALDPRDGQVLAMVSLPTYDNNFFAEGITSPEDFEKYQALLDDPHTPLINHAIADLVPPGSTFKIIPATAGLQEGVINGYTTLDCPGRILLPNKLAPNDPGAAQPFYCWIYLQHGGGHGPLTVTGALAQSCDIFFYKLGGGFEESKFEGLGVTRLIAWTERFGLGDVTGIDIPGERAVAVFDPKTKRDLYQETWTTGDTYNMSIGQGFLTVTPLQMANVMAAAANNGIVYQPRLIHHIVNPEGNMVVPFLPEVLYELPVDDAVWQLIHEGLEGAVYGGTAPKAQVEGVRVAGKTGTAEYCDNLAQEAGLCPVPEGEVLPTHAWFMAYAPAEAPEIVVVAWVYNGGEGSTASVPIAQEVLDFYFKRAAGQLEPAETSEEVENPAAP
ncbi:MAG: penicillin-binding protein 2, partial [Anaerolineae bacterium]|nr:penicillin-binding protein 2 [Anaerolineae bacterium]